MNTQPGARRPLSPWVGWINFAAVFMIVSGTFGAIQGLAAIARDDSYFLGDVLTFNLTAWGWIHLLLGLVVIATGVMLLRGMIGGLILAIAVVFVHMVANFTWIGAYPWWSLIAIAFDVIVMYALIVHGDELVD